MERIQKVRCPYVPSSPSHFYLETHLKLLYLKIGSVTNILTLLFILLFNRNHSVKNYKVTLIIERYSIFQIDHLFLSSFLENTQPYTVVLSLSPLTLRTSSHKLYINCHGVS